MMACAARFEKITRRELGLREKIVFMMELHMIEITQKNKIKLCVESRCNVGAKIGSGVRSELALIPFDMHGDLKIRLHELIHSE